METFRWWLEAAVVVIFGWAMEAARKYLAAKHPNWMASNYLSNVLRNIAFLGIIFFVFTGHAIKYQAPELEQITAATVDSLVMKWLTEANLPANSASRPQKHSKV